MRWRTSRSKVPLPSEAAPRLGAVRAETNLKLPDCCVLLALDDASAEGLITFEERLASQAKRLGHAVG